MKKKKLYRIYVGGSYSDEVWATSQVSAVRAFRAKGGDYRNYSVKARAVKANASRRRNPPATKAGRRKASVERRVAAALAKYLRQQNPGMKTAGAKVQKLKGGVLKITPIRATKRGRR